MGRSSPPTHLSSWKASSNIWAAHSTPNPHSLSSDSLSEFLREWLYVRTNLKKGFWSFLYMEMTDSHDNDQVNVSCNPAFMSHIKASMSNFRPNEWGMWPTGWESDMLALRSPWTAWSNVFSRQDAVLTNKYLSHVYLLKPLLMFLLFGMPFFQSSCAPVCLA